MIPKELFDMMGKSGGKVAIGGLPILCILFTYIYIDSNNKNEKISKQDAYIHRLDSAYTALKTEVKTTRDYFTQTLNNFIDCETDKDKLENEIIELQTTMNRYGVPYINTPKKRID